MPTCSRSFPILAALLSAVLPLTARAQSAPYAVGPQNATGVQEYNPYGGAHENINLGTGDLNLQIPLLSLPGRNGHNFTLSLVYDSKIWQSYTEVDPIYGDQYSFWNYDLANYVGTLGWHFNWPTLTASVIQPVRNNPNYYCTGNFILTTGDGAKHAYSYGLIPGNGVKTACYFINTQGQIIQEPQMDTNVGGAYDSSYYVLDVTNPSDIVARGKDGSAIHFAGSNAGGSPVFASKLEDTDGNIITGMFTDTVGRAVSLSWGTPNTTVSYKDSSGTQRTITLTTAAQTLSGTFQLPTSARLALQANLLSSITLPNSLTWSFQYNAYGELTKVVYPTGGYSRYAYAAYTAWIPAIPPAVAVAADFREVTTRYVCRLATGNCSAGTTPEDVTTYTPTIDGTKTNNQYMDVVTPLGDKTRHQFSYSTSTQNLPLNSSQRETFRYVYQGQSTLLRTIETDYNSLDTYGNTTFASLPIRETVTLNDVSPNLVMKTEWDYSGVADQVSEERDFDYGSGSVGPLVRKKDYTWLGVNPVNNQNYAVSSINILNRKSSEQIKDASGNIISQTQYEYDRYDTSTNHAVLQASGAIQHDSAFSTSYTFRGNVTAAQHWRNTDNSWLTTVNQYDDAGNALKSFDPANNSTSHSYTDSWSNATCAPSGGSAKAYVTTTTNALLQSATSTFNSCSGTIASITDANSRTVNDSYDLMGRLTQVNNPDGGLITRTFNESSMPLSITPSVEITSGASLIPPTILDGIGRPLQTQLTSDPEGTDYTDTTYDPLERKKTVSNPYRTTSDPTYGITTYNYDALGRIVQIIPPDGTATSNNTTTVYSGNCATVTDQAGKKRKTCTDALGRLKQVFEPDVNGNLVNETDYQYNILNGLLCVHQRGTDTTPDKTCTDSTVPATWRPRTFTYNSLSQLLTANNPESGTITYTYDVDGNVVTKTDARAIVTTYFYDALNRLTKKTYSDSTPQITYWYDGHTPTGCTPPTISVTNGAGRRTAMCDAGGSEAWSYDSMGRVLTEARTTNGVTKTTNYTYNFDSSLATLTYPSGRVVKVTTSGAGRALSAVDVANGINYATAALYAPFGALSSVQYGTNLASKMYYNPRLQPCRISVQTSGTPPTQCSDSAHIGNMLDLSYNYSLSVANNGNVSQITNNVNTNRSLTYTYDSMNRIKTAITQGTTGALCWGLDYGYDVYANLLTQSLDTSRPSCSGYVLNAGVNTNNRLTNSGFSYDASGNVLSDVSNNYTWDAESELKTAAGITYTYDGDGRRVQKSNGKLYWYGATGDILDESDGSGNITDEFVFFDGKRIARRNISSGNVYYYLADHLGTSRVIVQAGQTSACYDADFDPFGGEHIAANTCPQNYKFNGKERDTETNLDDFEARYYSSAFGRFHSADWSAIPVPVPYADLGNPQTLNLYAYVKNNPMNLTDPTGHEGIGGFRTGNNDARTIYLGGGGLDPNDAEEGWMITVNGESTFYDDYNKATDFYNQAAAQQAQSQSGASNLDKRTDVMLSADSVPPKPSVTEGAQFEMDYRIVPQADTMQQLQDNVNKLQNDPATQAKYSKMETKLWESQRGEQWQWQGGITGKGHDVLNVFAKNADQRWYIDGKRVQLVIGKDASGTLIKAWTVHVEVTPSGPRFSKVD